MRMPRNQLKSWSSKKRQRQADVGAPCHWLTEWCLACSFSSLEFGLCGELNVMHNGQDGMLPGVVLGSLWSEFHCTRLPNSSCGGILLWQWVGKYWVHTDISVILWSSEIHLIVNTDEPLPENIPVNSKINFKPHRDQRFLWQVRRLC